jgi:LacI family transcriptional regulator
VRRIARELGYMPNSAAKAVRCKRFGAIGLLQSTDINAAAMPQATIWALEQEMLRRDTHLVIGQLPEWKTAQEGFAPKLLREWSVDGLLVSYTFDPPDGLARLIEDHQVPSVWINNKLPGNCVYPDDHDTARRAAEHLIGLGHRRIAYAGPVKFRHYSVEDRRGGYSEAMAAAGLKEQIIPCGRDVNREFAGIILEALRRPDRPTAILLYDPSRAFGVFYSALRVGLDIPRDLSVMAVSNGEVLVAGMALSAVVIPCEQMGRAAVEMLAERIAEPAKVLPPRALPAYLFGGQTAAVNQANPASTFVRRAGGGTSAR